MSRSPIASTADRTHQKSDIDLFVQAKQKKIDLSEYDHLFQETKKDSTNSNNINKNNNSNNSNNKISIKSIVRKHKKKDDDLNLIIPVYDLNGNNVTIDDNYNQVHL